MTNYESIVHEIQSEAKQFQNDNFKLKSHLDALISENDRLRAQNAEEAQASLQNFKRDFIAVADTTIMNLQNQILMINKVYYRSTHKTDYYLNSILIFNLFFLGKGNVREFVEKHGFRSRAGSPLRLHLKGRFGILIFNAALSF